jgi:hypothetical protein
MYFDDNNRDPDTLNAGLSSPRKNPNTLRNRRKASRRRTKSYGDEHCDQETRSQYRAAGKHGSNLWGYPWHTPPHKILHFDPYDKSQG